MDRTRAKTTRRTRITNRRDSSPPKSIVYSVMCVKLRILGDKEGKAIAIQCAAVKELGGFSRVPAEHKAHYEMYVWIMSFCMGWVQLRGKREVSGEAGSLLGYFPLPLHCTHS